MRPRRLPGHHPHAQALTRAMVSELEDAYGEFVIGNTPSASPFELSPPDGIFVVIYDDKRPVAGGGVKRLDAQTGEIKRMYVVPEARRQGVARRLLEALEDAARDLGYKRVRLDTGTKQPHAEALYRSAGYKEIGNYNDNAYASYWAEKAL